MTLAGFLNRPWHDNDALYAAFVLVLVLGLRKGEVLGLAWELVDLDAAELYVGEQLQRVRRQLVRREVKTESVRGAAAAARPVRRRSQAPQAAAGRRS